jgi:hypothetical protein
VQKRPVFVVKFRAERDVDDPVRALRALLKSALRRHGMRVVEAYEEPEDLPESISETSFSDK